MADNQTKKYLLFNVTPRFSMDNIANSFSPNVKFPGENNDWGSIRNRLTDFSYVFFFQFRHGVLFSANLFFWMSNCAMSFSFNAITHILKLCSKIKMLWIYAFWIVAMMKNAKLFRNFSAKEHPRSAMGQFDLGQSFPSGNNPITCGQMTTKPFPAMRVVICREICQEPALKCCRKPFGQFRMLFEYIHMGVFSVLSPKGQA